MENKYKKLRLYTGMTQREFASFLGTHIRTVEAWETGKRNCPNWVFSLIKYKIENEFHLTSTERKGKQG